MKGITELFAVLLPISGCLLLGVRLWKHDKASWQMMACFSALLIATSLILLTASERISFLRYGDAVVQVNEKLEETRRLTEQNKKLAKATVALVAYVDDTKFASSSYDSDQTKFRINSLLTEAGLSPLEIEKFLKEMTSTNAVPATK
jgi:di/tricarboxylate transporter